MSTRRHLLLLPLALLLPCTLLAQGAPTTVILVRHAEKAATPANDPGLTQAGLLRAKTLAHVAGSTNAAAVFVSQFRRTKQTVKPLAAALGLDPARDFVTYPTLGNTGSAALPTTLALAEQAGRLSPGDRVALLGIGSGINVVMAGVEWGPDGGA